MPIKINSTGGGSVSIDVPSTGGTYTLTAPANNATIFTTDGGAITGNVAFTSNNVTIAGQTVSPYGAKNKIINGDMRIDQRNSGASVTPTNDVQIFTVDRWQAAKSNDATESLARNTDAPAGFSHSLRNTVSVADASIGSTQYSGLIQVIEGYNIADFAFGTSNAKTITLSFWVKTTQTGTYSAVLQGGSPLRQVFKAFTVSASNTWEYKTLTFTGDTNTGSTWNVTNSNGLNVQIYFALGSAYMNGTDGVWAANSSYNYGPVGMTNGLATNGNICAITGVQLEEGPIATPFERRPYGTELALCQRYAFVPTQRQNVGGIGNGTAANARFPFPVTMRAAPTASILTAGSWIVGNDYSTNYTASTLSLNGANMTASGGRVQLAGFPSFSSAFWVGGSDVEGTAVILLSAEF